MRVYSFLPRLYEKLRLMTGEEAQALETDAKTAYDKINTLPTNDPEVNKDNKNWKPEQPWTHEHTLKKNVAEKLWFRQLLPLGLWVGKRKLVEYASAPIVGAQMQRPMFDPYTGQPIGGAQAPAPQQQGYSFLD